MDAVRCLEARPDARRDWYRVVAGDLVRALRAKDTDGLPAAGALASALLEREADGAVAARRAAALLDTALIAGDPLAPSIGTILAAAADELVAGAAAATPSEVARRVTGVLRAVAARATSRPPAPSLDAVVPAYCAEHLHRGARLQDLARRLGYSPSHCSALVRRATGEPFTALRRRLMVERAIGLLQSGASVKAAALGAGFSEPAYFSRVFSRRFGVPPSRWREVVDDTGAALRRSA